jgi:anti-sigma-K factor RskA
MNTEEHYFDLLSAYALGILDEEEQLQVSEHLTFCSICRAELMAYDQVVQDLPLAMVESKPADTVKNKVMAHARKDENTLDRTSTGSWWTRISHAIRVSAPAWGLVSLILIMVLGFSNIFLWDRLNEIERVAQNALISIPMQGTDTSPQAVGMLVVSQNGKHGTLIVDGLPILEETSQYQLWLIRDGQRTSGGVFSVGDDGYGSLWVASPDPLLSYSDFGITVEPAGGSPGPTGPKVLGGRL